MNTHSTRWLSIRSVLRFLAAILFVVAGAMHFVLPVTYIRMIPPGLPAPGTLVMVSGIAEIAGGVGLLVPALRRTAGIGLILLLICVFPANLHMARRPDLFADIASPAMLWARLPLQAVLIAWVIYAMRKTPKNFLD